MNENGGLTDRQRWVIPLSTEEGWRRAGSNKTTFYGQPACTDPNTTTSTPRSIPTKAV
jgi:hypothetical protein